jgi:hypothetical protein
MPLGCDVATDRQTDRQSGIPKDRRADGRRISDENLRDNAHSTENFFPEIIRV